MTNTLIIRAGVAYTPELLTARRDDTFDASFARIDTPGCLPDHSYTLHNLHEHAESEQTPRECALAMLMTDVAEWCDEVSENEYSDTEDMHTGAYWSAVAELYRACANALAGRLVTSEYGDILAPCTDFLLGKTDTVSVRVGGEPLALPVTFALDIGDEFECDEYACDICDERAHGPVLYAARAELLTQAEMASAYEQWIHAHGVRYGPGARDRVAMLAGYEGDAIVRTIASYYQSPGHDGAAFAALASTGAVRAGLLHDSASAEYADARRRWNLSPANDTFAVMIDMAIVFAWLHDRTRTHRERYGH